MGRINRKRLPDAYAAVSQKIDESISVLTQVPVPETAGQGRDMQKNAGPTPVQYAVCVRQFPTLTTMSWDFPRYAFASA
jgi:hypothetical protein